MHLTPKQEKFCQKYIELGNASEAYRQTYNSSEMKSETVNRKAKVELDKGKIRARIQELQDRHLKRHDITVDGIIAEYAKIGFSNIKNYVKWTPYSLTLIESESIPDEQSSCIQEITQTVTKDGGSIKFKLHDKKGALDSLGRHFGIFVDKHEITGKDGKPIEWREVSDDEINARIAELSLKI